MIVTKSLTAEQVRLAMERGEFPPEVIAAGRNVAVIMTQSWCGQWLLMQPWLGGKQRKEEDNRPTVDVFILEYDREPFFEEFLAFKERVFGNDAVPYIRFYRDGRLVKESNAIGRLQFYGVFREDTKV